MANEIFLQNWIFTRFALPFLLVFVVLYAVLEKTKILGDDKHQINAIVSFVISAIFVGVLYPTTVVSNLMLFLTVALIVVFVALVLWGFISGEGKFPFMDGEKKGFKIVAFIVLLVSVIIAVLWATGIQGQIIDILFRQDWSESLWINIAFVVMVAIAFALVLTGAKKSSSP